MHICQRFAYDPTTNCLIQQQHDLTYKDHTYCIKLKRNLYGCKQASCNWFLYLAEGLNKHGFIPSKSNPCLFLRHDAIICLYTDDCCIFAKDPPTIDALIQDLSSEFLLKE